MKIAIVGTGISGLSAAYLLNRHHDITVFEKADRLGGHSNTVDVDYDGKVIPVDTGFIVYNEHNYPNLVALFDHLGVASQSSNMSFSVSARNGRTEWAGGNFWEIFAQKKNLFSPSFIHMLTEILRFNRQCVEDLEGGHLTGCSLGEYLDARNFAKKFRDLYLLPMGGAIWSTSPQEMLHFPAESFVSFFNNHRLIYRERPLWRTVTGGSREYVKKISASFADKVRLNAAVTRIQRVMDGVFVESWDGSREKFDHVVIATHSDQALGLLSDAQPDEQELLSALRYAPNKAYLHRDPALMPNKKVIWSSWNYMCGDQDGPENASTKTVSVSYWMNRLQNIDKKYPLFVSLNPAKPPRDHLTFASFDYDHPQFDGTALNAQQQLPLIQGTRRTWFAGAYCGSGFHEDGLKAGLHVARELGAVVPWEEDQIVREAAE